MGKSDQRDTRASTSRVQSGSRSIRVSVPLVAVATAGDARVRLVDLRSGDPSHSLPGHAAPVTALTWHPGSEWMLVSGDRSGAALLWDVRMNGRRACMGALDRFQATGAPLPRSASASASAP